jgi:succinyl-CoA synthetase beta subunit
MRLYECEAKRLLRSVGAPLPDGVVVDEHSFAELEKVTYPVIIKAQVFLGGRGKAGFVQSAGNKSEATDRIRGMLGKKHGPFLIEKVLVERAVTVQKELYCAATIDRLTHQPVLMTSTRGGVDIEELAQVNGAIIRYYFKAGDNLYDFQARKAASGLGLSGSLLSACSTLLGRLYALFLRFDCKLVEINPLCVTEENRLCCLDAKIDLDEDAMFRHPEFQQMGIVARHEVGELTEREKIAKANAIPYVDLDGDIGVFPGGAGFGIAAIDLIEHYGGRPANFMDSGGAPTQEKLRAMLGLLIDNPRVKAIFGARFGGISRCDDWAQAVVQYIFENKPLKPMIMRMTGNMEEAGRKILEQAKKDHPDLFKNIKVYSYDTPIEDVIRETIRVAYGK